MAKKAKKKASKKAARSTGRAAATNGRFVESDSPAAIVMRGPSVETLDVKELRELVKLQARVIARYV